MRSATGRHLMQQGRIGAAHRANRASRGFRYAIIKHEPNARRAIKTKTKNRIGCVSPLDSIRFPLVRTSARHSIPPSARRNKKLIASRAHSIGKRILVSVYSRCPRYTATKVDSIPFDSVYFFQRAAYRLSYATRTRAFDRALLAQLQRTTRIKAFCNIKTGRDEREPANEDAKCSLLFAMIRRQNTLCAAVARGRFPRLPAGVLLSKAAQHSQPAKERSASRD